MFMAVGLKIRFSILITSFSFDENRHEGHDDLFDVPEERIFKQDNGQKSHEFSFDYAI